MLGAVERVRPKMMTVVAIMAGLVPILWSTGTGSEVMQRIAVPMIGGMVSSTMLTLVVIPAIYALVKGFHLRREAGAGSNREDEPNQTRGFGGRIGINKEYNDAQPPTAGAHIYPVGCALHPIALKASRGDECQVPLLI